MKDHDILGAQLLTAVANPKQVRLDAWNRVRDALDRMEAKKTRGASTSDDEQAIRQEVGAIRPYERLWVYPGKDLLARLEDAAVHQEYHRLATDVRQMVHMLGRYGDRASVVERLGETCGGSEIDEPHYFTVVVVDSMAPSELEALERQLHRAQEGERKFIYELLVVDNFEDAALAVFFNDDVQACVLAQDFSLRPTYSTGIRIPGVEKAVGAAERSPVPRAEALASFLRSVRPEVDLYLMSDESLESNEVPTSQLFDRVFYQYEAWHELHVSIMSGVEKRYATPFFDALKAYARRPIGNFHALPIARGNSVLNSRWIRDMGEFYGQNIFMAESSSTSGGLDSLLEPTGAIKEAQEKAARAWGAQRSYFVTNGTSTANKIVLQALTAPGDVVLIDRNCHKSHHYGLVLAGALPVYLDAYPLQELAMYGGVPLRTIKKALLDMKRAGRLDSVKMLLLTNCTFDGLVYNPARVMEEVLAIKPDICFLWDEAWYAFARFHPLARARTGMWAAETLAKRYASPEYRAEYAAYRSRVGNIEAADERTWLEQGLMPDPDRVRIRAYATQSTHKSLSAFRQGSMIHVWDQDFERMAGDAFVEAYWTHTSTSPNHQITASLDLARRQVELEGFGMVKEAYQLAMRMRERVRRDPLLNKYFSILDAHELVPRGFRQSGLDSFVGGGGSQLATVTAAWHDDEFVLDPTRLTLYLGRTGIDGATFKLRVLMDEFGVQVNKSSINSVLFLATIGVNWSALSFLLDVLRREAAALDQKLAGASAAERHVFDANVRRITDDLPPLPNFSEFHEVFRPFANGREGDIRRGFYAGNREENREYIPLARAAELLGAGRELVATNLVVPYPPGFPVLVPGQVVSPDILEFMIKLDVKEVHGYRADLGLSVFSERALAAIRRGETVVPPPRESKPGSRPSRDAPRFH